MIDTIIGRVWKFVDESPENQIPEEHAIRDGMAGMRIWQRPVFAVGDADDPRFLSLRDPDVLHPDFMIPAEWVPGAKSVISFMMHFTDEIVEANIREPVKASPEWIIGTAYGQKFLIKTAIYIKELLEEAGYEAAVPSADPRFKMVANRVSCWSERHVANICGLGTFSLTRGLITEKGMAGRIGSVVTTAPLEVTQRKYTDAFEYCTRCGLCAVKCPAGAIDITKDIKHAKDNQICSDYINSICKEYQGMGNLHFSGCGKCQVGLPCTNGIPVKKQR